jgi:hypothetical protein
MSETNKKIALLRETGSDWEWYPTTDEILTEMNRDLYGLFKSHRLEKVMQRSKKHERLFDSVPEYKDGRARASDKPYCWHFYIDSFLDVGAGDGRVFDSVRGFGKDEMSIKKRYGVEKARAQVRDLIKRDVFVIGGDFFSITLIDKHYSVIFSNPPYSAFEMWVEKLLKESNFGILYLVIPIRWKNSERITHEFERHEVMVLGEFTFENGDREARGRVNLIRLTHRQKEIEGIYYEVGFQDAFTRWIDDNIGGFRDEKEDKKIEDEKSLKLRQGDIGDLLENYEYEQKGLADAFRAIGKLPARTLHAIGLSRESIHEIIRKDIESLKEYHWNLAFDKLSAIKSRLTKDVRHKLFQDMREFTTLDFNADNIYSIVIWIINHCNLNIPEQVCAMFDTLTHPNVIHAYKSNVHWEKGDWQYNYKDKPSKYYLDYRIVTRSYVDRYAQYSIVDDFAVVCKNLGFEIVPHCQPDYKDYGGLQMFYTVGGDVAFTVRMYMNGNFHFKINQKLMLRFNVEVAKIKKWLTCPQDIQDEFDVPEAEAVNLWKTSGILLPGNSDMKLLGFSAEAE